METKHVVAAVLIHDGKVFATQRGYGEYKDKWEFPGGKIDAGETPQQALVREIREELDTEIEVGDLIERIETDYPTFHLSMGCYFCKVVSGSLTLLEHEDSRWLDAEHLYEVDWLPADRALLPKIELKLMEDDMSLETKRLVLRPWTDEDAESMYEYAKDPEIGPPAGWPPHTSVEESLSIIRSVFIKPESYAICLKEDRKAIGAIALKLAEDTDLTDKDDECELGYWLGKPFWGQGIMPEAADELIRHAFEDLNMSKVWCAYYDGNTKSKRVQEKCGFVWQWTTPNVDVPLLNEVRIGHVNLLTREDWESKRHDT